MSNQTKDITHENIAFCQVELSKLNKTEVNESKTDTSIERM